MSRTHGTSQLTICFEDSIKTKNAVQVWRVWLLSKHVFCPLKQSTDFNANYAEANSAGCCVDTAARKIR